MSTNFQALLDELDVLAKAQAVEPPAAGAQGEDTAAGAGASDELEAELERDEKDRELDAEGDELEDEEEDGEATLGKSFSVTLADGSKVDAFDATEMMKGLLVQVEERKGEAATLAKALGVATGVMAGLQNTVNAQGDLIKSLQADIGKLRKAGAGRKATLSVHERPSTTVPTKPAELTGNDIMAKALSLNSEGKLTSLDVARLQARVNRPEGGRIILPDDLAPHFA